MKKVVIELKGNGHPRFYSLMQEEGELHDYKNARYSSRKDPLSNFRECEEFNIPSWLGCIVRMSDKWSRIKQLARMKQEGINIDNEEETIIDTLRDISVYAKIAIILYEEENK